MANDVDKAVDVATEAFNKVWKNTAASERGRLLNKLADLIERDIEELAAIEALENGKAFSMVKAIDIPGAIKTYRYCAGYADKIYGKVRI